MPRFFVPADALGAETVAIVGDDAGHIARVLRMGPGDTVIAIAPGGEEYEVEISEAAPGRVAGRILRRVDRRVEPSVRVTLVQGLPKGDKMELIIQKCTELGVFRIIPAGTERSIVRLDSKKAEGRRERWQKIAREAAEQSGRTAVPEVAGVTDLAGALRMFAGAHCGPGPHRGPGDGTGGQGARPLGLIPWEEEKSLGLKTALRRTGRVSDVWLFIGPEGGFSPQEARSAREAGIIPVTLGPRILRTETAGMVALTMVLYEIGDLGGD